MRRNEFEHHLQLVDEPESTDAIAKAAAGAGDVGLPEEQMLSWAFGEIGTHIQQIAPSLEVQQRVMKAFDRELRMKQRYSPKWSRYAAGIAAAVLLAALASLALLRHQSNSASSGGPATNEFRATITTVGSPPVQTSGSRPQVKRNRQINGSTWARREPARAASPEAPPEIATDFIRINARPIEPGDQIVRVQLPRSAMAQFGLPVNMDRSDKPVKADVIMGMDGVAQAIRFVQ